MDGCSGDTLFDIVGGVEEGFGSVDDGMLFEEGVEVEQQFDLIFSN